MRFILIRMRYIYLFITMIIFFSGQSIGQKQKPDSISNLGPLVITKTKTTNDAIENIKRDLNNQADQLKRIEKKISLYQNKINDHSHVIDSNLVRSDEMLQFQTELKTNLYNQQTNSNEDEYITVLNKLQRKIQILEDRTFYTDSLYFEIVTDMVLLENKISSLLLSFKEINDLSSNKISTNIPQITDEEFTAKYIESLSQYQNSEWETSLNGFSYLIQANNNHDLADNCQYWIGEVYYALNDYKRSIREFEKVFSFLGTNKGDDAQFKIGVCYMNIGELDRALQEFNNLMESYPNSEYYNRAQNYINQY